jgi:hypothetical protein
MGKRRFRLELSGTAIIELDDQVINVVDAEWRRELYNLRTPEAIATMVGGNLIRGATLSQLNGWANQPDENAKIVSEPEWEIETKEITHG